MTEKKVTFGQAIDQIIEALGAFEGNTQQTIISAVCAHLGLTRVAAAEANDGGQQTEASPPKEGEEATQQHVVDIRFLKEKKNPKTAQEMACLVGYYLGEIVPKSERKPAISSEDLETYFKQAGFKIPKAIQQVLKDGKSSGYFENKGHGAYKLTPVGYNLVVHNLPREKK